MYSLKNIMKIFIYVFPMIFQILMSLRKSRCDILMMPPMDGLAPKAL